jgi:hypothetical protein
MNLAGILELAQRLPYVAAIDCLDMSPWDVFKAPAAASVFVSLVATR